MTNGLHQLGQYIRFNLKSGCKISLQIHMARTQALPPCPALKPALRSFTLLLSINSRRRVELRLELTKDGTENILPPTHNSVILEIP